MRDDINTEQQVEIVDHVVPFSGWVFSDEMSEMSHTLPLAALVNRLQNQRYHPLSTTRTIRCCFTPKSWNSLIQRHCQKCESKVIRQRWTVLSAEVGWNEEFSFKLRFHYMHLDYLTILLSSFTKQVLVYHYIIFTFVPVYLSRPNYLYITPVLIPR